MAVAVQGSHTLLFAAAGDLIAEALFVRSIQWTTEMGTAGDDLVIVDPTDTAKVLYDDNATGLNYAQESIYHGQGRYFPNGLRVHTLTSGQVYVNYV